MSSSNEHRVLRAAALMVPVVLAALHPLVFIVRTNAASTNFAPDSLIRPLAFIVVAALAVLLLFRSLAGSLRAASVAGTLFFVILGVFPFVFPHDRGHKWFESAGFVLAALAATAALTRLLSGMIGVVVAWVIGILVLWNATAACVTATAVWPMPSWRDEVNHLVARAASVRLPAEGARPDIYYIVLDGLARDDFLEAQYGLDVRYLRERLERLGFQIPSRSRSNYAQTQLSFASSLNMQYVNSLASAVAVPSDRRPLTYLTKEAGSLTALERHGYELVVVKSGTSVGLPGEWRWGVTDLLSGPTELEYALLVRVPGPHLLWNRATLRAHRQRVLRSLDGIESAATKGPMFLAAHVMSPHPPFVLAEDGTERMGPERFTFRDGDGFPGSRTAYISGYRAQAAFVLSRMADIAERIISRSPDAIIIIHGDHGSGLGLVNGDATRTDAFERLANFAAYYSGGRDAPVPETMSPVNALRWAFRYGLGADIELLPDRSYLSDYRNPYQFTELEPERLDAVAVKRR